MLNIQKTREPSSFTQHRCQKDACYGNLPTNAREDLKKQLLEEQGHLCAYCMCRIGENSMKIEHVASRDKHPESQLDYTNLVAVCKGNEGSPKKEQHCDTRKGNYSLSKNPARQQDRVQESISYMSSGCIHCKDALFDKQINSVLNLNLSKLCNNRKEIWDVVHNGLKNLPQNANRAQIQAMLDRWLCKSTSGQFKPYLGVAIFLLERRLRACTR